MPAKGLGVQFDDELERMYDAYERKRGSSMEEIVLGDASYARRFKMPKYNILVSMLQEPKVALRHWNTLGVPTSKDAHRQRAEYFTRLYHEIGKTYNQLGTLAGEVFGNHGPQVSGIIRNHFPPEVKHRLRFLSSAKNLVGDAARTHEYLSKTRSPIFT